MFNSRKSFGFHAQIASKNLYAFAVGAQKLLFGSSLQKFVIVIFALQIKTSFGVGKLVVE